MIADNSRSTPVAYWHIREALNKHNFNIRLKEYRSYQGTFLRAHSIMSELVDLIQDRISKKVFVRHYLALDTKQFCTQVLSIIGELESKLT